ncbi:unnamed protein product [Rotaria socialis]|uniref:RRM domain-containing protein n=1 Tax=Rotaria socialis TaxID=392032 RepID=A0A818MD99_9BILA|nr:unnamed protein product [Rotaria socialis]CAF4570641.1 unnamed protein product [Rotaria socialis]
MSSYNRSASTHYLEVCISSIGYHTEPHTVLTHFEQFGTIDHYNFTSPDGRGFIFITYTNLQGVDRCMSSRPHRLDGQHLYVKRAVPYTDDNPREHIDTTRDLLIVVDSINVDEHFLKCLREYFSSYGTLYACKYCHEANFDYILVEFADYDQVDRIILDKPHYFNEKPLNIMKCTSTNKILMNIKYASKNPDSVDIDDKFLKFQYNLKNTSFQKKDDSMSEIDLEKEVNRLETLLKKTTENFNVTRKQLEDDCCEQLRKLNADANRTHQLQQDLEQEYTKLLVEYKSLTCENDGLNEQYLQAELENFEITSYYEQVLADATAETAQLEAEYTEKLEIVYANGTVTSASSRPASVSRTSTSLTPPAIPDEDNDDNEE